MADIRDYGLEGNGVDPIPPKELFDYIKKYFFQSRRKSKDEKIEGQIGKETSVDYKRGIWTNEE